MLKLNGLNNILIIDENFIEIKQKSFFTGKPKSDKKIPFKSITSIELRKPGLILAGYLQITEIGDNKNKGIMPGVFQAAQDENSVLFKGNDNYNIAVKIKSFIEMQLINTSNFNKTQGLSSADEILKYKNLLDQGIITANEFETKKKQLLIN